MSKKDKKKNGGLEGVLEVLSETDTQMKAVIVSEYKGRTNCHIRSFFRNDEDSDWQFGKGIVLDANELNTLIDSEALRDALEMLEGANKKKKKTKED